MSAGPTLAKAELAALRMLAKSTEGLLLAMAVEMNNLKKDVRLLKADQHPPVALRPVVLALLDELGVKHK